MLTPFFILFMPSSARAGDPGPLCDAVAQASVVAEVAFTSQGEYPSAWRRKRWEPPEEAVLPTVATARVVRVYKGDTTGWVPELQDLDFSNQAATWWDRFYDTGEFRALVMLSGTAPALEASGWLADDGSCHVSWCWQEHRAAVLACLEAQGVATVAVVPVPAEVPAEVGVEVAAPAEEVEAAGGGGWFKGCAGR